ncbi:hypothetical protein JQ628_25755 [Bradyrhizobium lablabi]|uniref:hypothetical protein n=1 Tax=Bradyrhizobium lablabi TaxID=722472 RepID=UPI001BA51AE9|nr:hypothetical protein [Bradyrhizobium lablabi]MBR1124953.1 hypothetical protein [Bradyrhizobium lablabi]
MPFLERYEDRACAMRRRCILAWPRSAKPAPAIQEMQETLISSAQLASSMWGAMKLPGESREAHASRQNQTAARDSIRSGMHHSLLVREARPLRGRSNRRRISALVAFLTRAMNRAFSASRLPQGRSGALRINHLNLSLAARPHVGHIGLNGDVAEWLKAAVC